MSEKINTDAYYKEARNYLTTNKKFFNLTSLKNKEFDHLVDLGASVMMTRDNVMVGGSFVCALIENNLERVIDRADDVAIVGIRALVCVKKYCFV